MHSLQVPEDISGKELADYLFLIANGMPKFDIGRPKNHRNCQLERMEKIAMGKQGEKLSTEDIIGLLKLMSRYLQLKVLWAYDTNVQVAKRSGCNTGPDCQAW